MRFRSLLVVTTLLAGAACSTGPSEAPASNQPDTPAAGVLGGANDVRLTSIVSIANPIALAMRSGDDTAFYLAQQSGRIVRVRNGEVTGTVLNISDLVSCCGERGLLGITFSPNGLRLYVNYTDNGGDTNVAWFRMDGRRALRGSRTLLLEVNQPFENHNGGDIHLNPADGLLYIALGDGGGQGDPSGNGQDKGSLLGKIVRIDPRSGDPYRNPSSNPFVGRPGRDEILHYGLRNPWRFSIDPETQTMWIGDVGQNTWEEIDRIPLSVVGANLGWDRMEGLHAHEGSEPSNHRRPIHEYSHSRGGCAITGGSVMRDPRLPGLDGVYVFSDYCDGTIRTLRRSDGSWVGGTLGIRASQVSSFGVGPGDRLFVLSLAGRVYRIDPA